MVSLKKVAVTHFLGNIRRERFTHLNGPPALLLAFANKREGGGAFTRGGRKPFPWSGTVSQIIFFCTKSTDDLILT